MAYLREDEMYPPVAGWLHGFLSDRHRGASVHVWDASRRSLARIIQEHNLHTHLPAEWPSWDIHVDVLGAAITEQKISLAFIECKLSPITLGHVSQLLGYSRVARPAYSFIISPQGMSDSLTSLLVTFQRTDVLRYDEHPGKLAHSIAVARWDEQAICLDYGSLVATDASFLGRMS